jgi:hypothetical protein
LPISNRQSGGRAGRSFGSAVRNLALATLIAAGLVVAFQSANAGENSSLSESNIEVAGARTPLNAELRRDLPAEHETVKTLTESLAESNAEAELFRRKFSELQLRMEALGLDAASKDRAKLEQRLLSAVSDLQLARKEAKRDREQMLRLSEAILNLLKTSTGGDPKARMDVEAELRRTNEMVAKVATPAEPQPSLMDGSVVSVKDDWSLVVGNLGERQGVKVGMPLRVVREGRQIARLRVVDVRQKICGAVIQEMDAGKEKVRVGDRLQADARQEISLK